MIMAAKDDAEVPNQLLKYLLTLAQMEEHSMLKLAGMTLIQEFLKRDNNAVRLSFLQNGILESLLLAFDKGLCNQEDLAYLDMSLKCIYFLSQLPVSPVQPLICEQVIRRMLMLVDTQTDYYQFPLSVKLSLQMLCEYKHMIGKVTEMKMNTEKWSYIHKVSKGKLKLLSKIPEKVYCCDVIESSESEEYVSVKDILIKKNLVWPDPFTESSMWSETASTVGNLSIDDDEDLSDIAVTHVVDGSVFWAQIGIETIQNVQKIEAILNLHERNGKLHRCVSQKGDHIVIKSKIKPDVCLMRALVKSVDMHGVHTWALDHGNVITVDKKCVFALPFDVHVDRYPPQVSLCCLQGLQPPPRSMSPVNSALAVLCNLIKFSYPAGDLLYSMDGLNICLSFLHACPDIDLQLQMCQLLSNLSCNIKISQTCTENTFMETVLEKTKLYYDMKPSKEKSELLLATLTALTNLMHYNDTNRSLFYQNQGIDIVLKCSMIYGRTSEVYKAAAKCMRMLVCKVLERVNKSPTKESAAKSPLKSNQSESSSFLLKSAPKVMSKLLGEEEEKLKFLWKPKSVEKVLHESRFTETCSSDEEVSDLDDLCTHRNEANKSSDRGSVAVDVADVYRGAIQNRHYILDSVVELQNNSVAELRPNKYIHQVSVNLVVQHVCGMLNSGKGGTIYFGLSPSSKVHGINLSRDDRDEFRLGVDRMMKDKLQPCLLHSFFDVVYIPVYRKLKSGELEVIPDCFVVEIQLKPTKGTIFTTAKDEVCFYRFGSSTTPLSLQELRQLIILEEEEEYMEKINVLKIEIKCLQQKQEQNVI